MTGVLLFHGFAGDESEVSPLRGVFDPAKYRVEICKTAGHTGRRSDLAKYSGKDWLESARQAYLELEASCGAVICIGFSMGGLLAAQVCDEFPADAAVFLNTPVYYWNFPQIFRNLKADLRQYAPLYLKNCFDKPLRSLFSFVALLRETRPVFARLTCPALILQTRDDDTVRPKSAAYINSALAGRHELYYLEAGGHVVLKSQQAAKALEQVKRFVDALEKEAVYSTKTCCCSQKPGSF